MNTGNIGDDQKCCMPGMAGIALKNKSQAMDEKNAPLRARFCGSS
jgi:hypothetical protein